ncbi:MAG: GrpB family protein [Candidatus Thermoplasmatota archaeon]
MADEARNLNVKVLPYDSEAPEIFEEIKQFIYNVVPFQIEVEHVGSTAVVGLGGSGIIDLLVITKEQHQLPEIAEILRNKGFTHNPEPKHAEDRFFVSGPYKYNERELHIHIHVTYEGSREHRDKLLFRDHLRRDPEEAKTYFEFKKRWSGKAGSDGAGYAELKTPYIHKVLEKAKRDTGD